MTRVPTDGEYVINRSMLIGGVPLQKGDRLPAESPLRAMPARLTKLCNMRRIFPAVTPLRLVSSESEEAPKVPEEEYSFFTESKAKAKASSNRFDRMTVVELKRIARANGLPVSGNKATLQERLRNALA